MLTFDFLAILSLPVAVLFESTGSIDSRFVYKLVNQLYAEFESNFEMATQLDYLTYKNWLY
jgi:hypothetical protein